MCQWVLLPCQPRPFPALVIAQTSGYCSLAQPDLPTAMVLTCAARCCSLIWPSEAPTLDLICTGRWYGLTGVFPFPLSSLPGSVLTYACQCFGTVQCGLTPAPAFLCTGRCCSLVWVTPKNPHQTLSNTVLMGEGRSCNLAWHSLPLSSLLVYMGRCFGLTQGGTPDSPFGALHLSSLDYLVVQWHSP